MRSIRDINASAAAFDAGGFGDGSRGGGSGSDDRSDACEYGGLGSEGGALTEATLVGGGRLLKVLGHAELAQQVCSCNQAATSRCGAFE